MLLLLKGMKEENMMGNMTMTADHIRGHHWYGYSIIVMMQLCAMIILA